jgi:hypothetical protein
MLRAASWATVMVSTTAPRKDHRPSRRPFTKERASRAVAPHTATSEAMAKMTESAVTGTAISRRLTPNTSTTRGRACSIS